jgi:alanine dehydrogenase
MTRRVAMCADRVFLRRNGRRTVSLMSRLLLLTDREAEPQGEASQRREPVLILNRDEVEELLDLEALLGALRDAFPALSNHEVTAPGRNELTMPGEAFLLGMPGRLRDGPMTVKVVTVFESHDPSHLATIGLYDARTGACRAFMDGTYITAIRTSAAAAVACDVLARDDARTLTIIGAGVQGEHHLRVFPLVRDFDEIRVCSLYRADAERVAALHPRAHVVDDPEAAVRGAHVIALATHAAQPVIETGWIAPGTHVSSVGYRPPDGELPRALTRERLFVETREAFEPTPVGCSELQGLDPSSATELGEVLLGRAPGRMDERQITVYKAMGHVVEDIVAAQLVYAAADGRGTIVTL